MQGGHELYDLNSGRVITRTRVIQICQRQTETNGILPQSGSTKVKPDEEKIIEYGSN
jgi:hypothetical protein